jgi:beta-glucosidase
MTCFNVARSFGKMMFIMLLALGFSMTFAASYTDYNAPIDDRVADLVSRLSTYEKITMRNRTSPAITRLNIQNYQWWVEMQNGWITIWPASIAKACSFDRDLCFKMGSIQGDEARIENRRGQQFYSPAVVNLAMDPRWGRNDEGLGEDPFLCGELAAQLIRGLQGNRQYLMPGGTEYYLKEAGMAKHYVGNEHENDRFNDVAVMDERDFYEYFMAPFKALVDADVSGVMTGLNKITVTGNPNAQAIWNYYCPFVLDTILRKQWGFKGYTSTDCSLPSNGPLALSAGIDGLCADGSESQFDTNTVNKTYLDRAIKRMFRIRFRLGEFDPDNVCAYRTIPAANSNSAEAKALALRAAREVVVLLKNTGNLLPLSKTTVKKIVVVGEMASHPSSGGDWSIFGGYSRNARNENTTCVLDAISAIAAANGMTLTYARGNAGSCINALSYSFTAAEITAMTGADIVIGVVGTDNKNTGFPNTPCQGDVRYPGEQRDLVDLKLPGVQEAMLSRAYSYNHKFVTVLQDQEVRTVPFVFDTCPAVVLSFPGGQQVGQGIVDVLFGDFNPSGRLSQTWIKNLADYPGVKTVGVPDNKNYGIRTAQRTYMYYRGAVNYPFGYGLSYTTFAYSNISAAMKNSDTVAVMTFSIQNSGTRAGAEVPQLYVHSLNASPERPIKELRNFSRVDIAAGATSNVTLAVTKRDLAYWSTTNKAFVTDAGKYEILIGSSSQDIRLKDTISFPTTEILVPHQQKEELSSQAAALGARGITMQRIFVDSRTIHFTGIAGARYDIYTCNGKKIMQRKGSEIKGYLSHAPHGVYMIMSAKQ